MSKHPRDRRRFSRWLLLVLLLAIPSTSGVLAGEANPSGAPVPPSNGVNPLDGDVLGFHAGMPGALFELLRRLFFLAA